MSNYTELLAMTEERVQGTREYTSIVSANFNAISAAYTYFRAKQPDDLGAFTEDPDLQSDVLQKVGVKGVNGAVMAFGEFAGKSSFEALPWTVSSKSSFHNPSINDLLRVVPREMFTDVYPEVIRAFVLDRDNQGPLFLLQEFDRAVPLQHKRAIGRVARNTSYLDIALLEDKTHPAPATREKKHRTRLTNFRSN